jgi:hypothetical protein
VHLEFKCLTCHRKGADLDPGIEPRLLLTSRNYLQFWKVLARLNLHTIGDLMSDEPSSLAEQMRAVRAGSNVGVAIGRDGRAPDSIFGATLGILMAGMLAVVVFAFPAHPPWLVGPLTVLYGVGAGVASAIYRQRMSRTSRITGLRYRVGFSVTALLYGVGVVVTLLGLPIPTWLWIAYIIATALPMLIASSLRPPRVS